MVRSFRRGALAAVLALTLAPLAAACAAGNDAASLEVQPDSASASSGPVEVQNALVLTQEGGPAAVSARLFNNGSTDQTLQSVRLAGGGTATLSAAGGGSTVTVPAHGSVLLGGQGNPAAVLDSTGESLRDGDVQQTVFTFSGVGPVSVPSNVIPASGFYAAFGPASAPTTGAPTGTPTGFETAVPTATGTATGESTPTP